MTVEKQSEVPKDINDKLSNLENNLNCIPQIEFLFLDNDNNQ
ncbi:MAG: hypothetical protein P1U46_01200 [Patescibacteria group bacterium]|nr:hypothetical protein [Patescibacteria group bacterium]